MFPDKSTELCLTLCSGDVSDALDLLTCDLDNGGNVSQFDTFQKGKLERI